MKLQTFINARNYCLFSLARNCLCFKNKIDLNLNMRIFEKKIVKKNTDT